MNNENLIEITENEEVQTEKKRKPSKLSAFCSRLIDSPNFYLTFTFVLPVLVMYLIYLAREIHPFGEASVLVLDLNAQYVYFFEALRRFAFGEADLLYSFSRALGGEFMGIFAYYVASPLSYIVCLFPKEKILDALLCLFLLKTGLCGLTFGYYLHKTAEKLNRFAVICLSLLYALSAYCIVQQHNTMWIDCVMWLPLIALGLESLIKYKKFKMFTFFLALTIFSNFYIGYMVCIFVAVYFFYYYFANTENGKNNPLGEKLHFLASISRTVLYSALACGMAMVIIYTAYYSLSFGKTDFTNPDFLPSSKFDFVDLLTKFFPASYDSVRPEGWPFVYCGVLTLFLVPAYFISKKFSAREKIASALLIIFFVMSFTVSTMDLVWHGFQFPNWLNYRYSFMLCFFLLVLSYKAFEEIRRIPSKFFIGVATVLTGFLFIIQKLDYENLDDMEGIWLSLLFVGLTLIMLCLVKKKNISETVATIMVIFICLETFCSGLSNCLALHDDVYYSSYASYNDFIADFRPLVEEVKENDDSFYRMEKTKHRKSNDNMALGIRGLTNSTSTLNAETIKFLNRMGYASKSHWSEYAGGNPVNDSLLGVKYIMSATQPSELYELAYGDDDDKYRVYRNPYALSVAFGVASGINDMDMEKEVSRIENLNRLIATLTGEKGNVFVPVRSSDYSTTNMKESYIAGHYKFAPVDTSDDAVLHYYFDVPKSGVEYFFYLPSEYPREVGIEVDGVSCGTFFANKTSCILSLGKEFTEGDTMTISLTIKKNEIYALAEEPCLYYLNTFRFEKAMETLAKTQYNVTSFTDSHLKGTITTTKGSQTVLSTIPYDEGWQVYLDGEKVEYYKTLGALIALDIEDAGEHTLEFRYMPKSFVLGVSCTCVCTVIFLALCVLDFKKNRKKSTAVPVEADKNAEEPLPNESEDVLPSAEPTEETDSEQ